MVGRTGFSRDNKKMKFTKSYVGEEVVETSDRLCDVGIWLIEEKKKLKIKVSYVT